MFNVEQCSLHIRPEVLQEHVLACVRVRLRGRVVPTRSDSLVHRLEKISTLTPSLFRTFVSLVSVTLHI